MVGKEIRFRQILFREGEAPWGLPVVWCSRQDGMATVKLFQKNDECQFMLQGEFAQGQNMIAPGAQFFRVAVRCPDKKSNAAHGAHLPVLRQCCQFVRGPELASLVHGDAQTSFAGCQQPFGNVSGIAVFDKFQFRLAEWLEAVEVKFHALPGIVQRRFSCGQYEKLHVGSVFGWSVKIVQQGTGPGFRNAANSSDGGRVRFSDGGYGFEFFQQQLFFRRAHAGGIVQRAFLHAFSV